MNFGSPTIQQLVNENAGDPVVAGLPAGAALMCAGDAQAGVAGDFFRNNRSDYVVSTAASPLAPQVGGQSRAGAGVATIAGTAVVFTVGGVITPLPDADYSLALSRGDVTSVNPNTLVDTRTKDGFTAYAAADGVAFTYIAQEPS